MHTWCTLALVFDNEAASFPSWGPSSLWLSFITQVSVFQAPCSTDWPETSEPSSCLERRSSHQERRPWYGHRPHAGPAASSTKTHQSPPSITTPLQSLQTWNPAASGTIGTATLGSPGPAMGWRGPTFSSHRHLPTAGQPPQSCPPVSSQQVTLGRPRLQGPSPMTPTPHRPTTPMPGPPAMERPG